MAEELTAQDVSNYTNGRLPADANTQRMLDAALARARTFAGWHVSPVETHTVTLHGSGFDFIVLPTLKIVNIVSINEDDEPVDIADTYTLSDEPGVLYRKRDCWSRCSRYEIEFNHGFTAAEAMDFRDVVLQYVDATSLSVGTGGMGPVTGVEVDDVSLDFSGVVDRGFGIAKNPLLESALYQYRILGFA